MNQHARAAALVESLDHQGLRLHADESGTWLASHQRLSAADARAWHALAGEVHAIVLARQGGVPARYAANDECDLC